MVAHPGEMSSQQDIHQQVAVSQQLLQQESLHQTIDSANLTTLQIIPRSHGDNTTAITQNLQIITQESLNAQGIQIIQQGGDTLPHSIQLIPNEGELTDASGQPLQIVSDGTGHGISFVQQTEAGDGNISQQMATLQDCEGIITIAMAPGKATPTDPL